MHYAMVAELDGEATMCAGSPRNAMGSFSSGMDTRSLWPFKGLRRSRRRFPGRRSARRYWTLGCGWGNARTDAGSVKAGVFSRPTSLGAARGL